MITGVPASMAATAEFVVPKSIPTIFSPGATCDSDCAAMTSGGRGLVEAPLLLLEACLKTPIATQLPHNMARTVSRLSSGLGVSDMPCCSAPRNLLEGLSGSICEGVAKAAEAQRSKYKAAEHAVMARIPRSAHTIARVRWHPP